MEKKVITFVILVLFLALNIGPGESAKTGTNTSNTNMTPQNYVNLSNSTSPVNVPSSINELMIPKYYNKKLGKTYIVYKTPEGYELEGPEGIRINLTRLRELENQKTSNPTILGRSEQQESGSIKLQSLDQIMSHNKVEEILLEKINQDPASSDKIKLLIHIKSNDFFNITNAINKKYSPDEEKIRGEMKGISKKYSVEVKSRKKGLDSVAIKKITKEGWDKITVKGRDLEAIKKERIKEMKHRLALANGKVNGRIRSELKKLGGKNINVREHLGIISAEVSIKNVLKLADNDYIEKIYYDFPRYTIKLDKSVPTVGASSWWTGGYTGGWVDVAVVDTGVDETHPDLDSDFEGYVRTFYQKDFTDDSDNEDYDGHGTHVAGTVASSHSTYAGVAKGVDKLIAAKFLSPNSGSSGDAIDAVDWTVSDGTIDTAEVVSNSWGCSYKDPYDACSINNGCKPDGETRSTTKYLDAVVDYYDNVVVVAAGNEGSCGTTSLGPPADAYNIISVGNIDDKGTTSRSDDSIASSSSQGPTYDGRKKPDIVAPGTNIKSTAHNWEGTCIPFITGCDFVDMSGTSMAAPHVSGAAALLKQYGLTSKEIKALLINTADDYGSSGWDQYYGWGSLNLASAYTYKDYVISSTTLPEGGFKLYEVEVILTGEKATLVWNRHVTYSGAAVPSLSNIYDLNDLDLRLYKESDGTYVVGSTTSKDNVEQIVYGGSQFSNGVVKVDAYTTDFSHGSNYESFTLSTQGGYSSKSGPSLGATLSNTDVVGPNQNFTVTATIVNSGDLAAHSVSATLSLPPGFAIVSGSNPQSIGSISSSGSGLATWSVSTSVGEGSYTLSADVTSNSYGESFSVSDSNPVSVDATPPSINIANPSLVEKGSQANLTITVTELQPDTYKISKNGSLENEGSYNNGVPFNISIDTSQVAIWNYTIWTNDTAGNSNFNSVFITIQDTTPPTITLHLPVNTTTSDNIPLLNVTFDELVNHTWYNVNSTTNTTFIGNTSNLTVQLETFPDGQHNITVYANDSRGNLNSKTIWFTIDTTLPTITIISPQNDTLTDRTPLFNVTFGETVNYTWYNLNSTTNSTQVSNTSNLTVELSVLPEGQHNITVYANDSYGNLNSSTVYFSIEIPPTLTIISPVNETSSDNMPLLNITFDESVNYTWYNLNSTSNSTLFGNTSNLTVQLETFPDGQHNITVYANDSRGNLNSSIVYFNIDSTSPNIIILSPENTTSSDSTPLLNVTFGEVVDYIWYIVNGTANRSLTSNVSSLTVELSALGEGQHNVTVYANDSYNNLNLSTVWFTIDTLIPNITNLTATPSSLTKGGLTNFTVNISDLNLDMVLLNITYPNSTVISEVMNSTGGYHLYDFNASEYGAYTARVIANDSAGNTNSSVSISFYAVNSYTNTTNVTNGSTVAVVTKSDLIIEVTANETKNVTVEITAELSPSTSSFSLVGDINNSSTDVDQAIKYLNVTNTTDLTNLSRIKIRMYYTGSEVSGLDNNTLAIYYWNGSNWFKTSDYEGSTIPNGPYVYDTGRDTSNQYVWTEVNHFSVYGLAGDIYVAPTPPNNPTTSSGGGGGGGGGSTAGNIVKIYRIDPGDTGVFTFESSKTPFMQEIQITTTTTSQRMYERKVTVVPEENKPSWMLDPVYEPYQYMTITSDMPGTYIEDITINFRVENSWLNENNINSQTVLLSRENKASRRWDNLITTKLKEDSEYTYYSASTEGFSYFVITGEANSGYTSTSTTVTENDDKNVIFPGGLETPTTPTYTVTKTKPITSASPITTTPPTTVHPTTTPAPPVTKSPYTGFVFPSKPMPPKTEAPPVTTEPTKPRRDRSQYKIIGLILILIFALVGIVLKSSGLLDQVLEKDQPREETESKEALSPKNILNKLKQILEKK